MSGPTTLILLIALQRIRELASLGSIGNRFMDRNLPSVYNYIRQTACLPEAGLFPFATKAGRRLPAGRQGVIP